MRNIRVLILIILCALLGVMPYSGYCSEDDDSAALDQKLEQEEIDKEVYNIDAVADISDEEAAGNKGKVIKKIRKNGGGAYASNPDCKNAENAIGITIATMIVMINVTVVMWALAPFFGFTPALVASALVTASAGLSLAQMVYLSGCTHAFVLDPVKRFDFSTTDIVGEDAGEGDYLICQDPSENGTCPKKRYIKGEKGNLEAYQRAMPSPSGSDWVEVCHRYPTGGWGEKHNKLFDREKDYGSKSLQNIKKDIGRSLECITLRSGEIKTLHTFKYEAIQDEDRVCVNLWGLKTGGIPFAPQSRIGCHTRGKSPPIAVCAAAIPDPDYIDANGVVWKWDNTPCFNCNVAHSCYNLTSVYAKAPLPITSVIIQCLQDTVQNILVGGCNGELGFIANVRNKLKQTIQAVLTLALAVFAIKMAMGAIQGHAEYFVLAIKFTFVIYFAAGPGMDEYYPQLLNISRGLSDMVLKAAGNPTVCNFETKDYLVPVKKATAGRFTAEESTDLVNIIRSQQFGEVYDAHNSGEDVIIGTSKGPRQISSELLNKLEFKNYSYIAPWDRLDCRIMFYLSAGVNNKGEGKATSETVGFGMIFMVLSLLGFGRILLFAILLFYLIIILLTIAWAVELYIIAMIALSLIVLVSPIFIPMMLFQATKSFFDSWLKELMAYTLYPVMIFTFLALFLSVFDKLYFGDLTFKESQYYATGSDKYSGKATRTYVLDIDGTGRNDCSDKRNATNLYCTMSNLGTRNRQIFGIVFNGVDIQQDSKEFWLKTLMLALMAFLFYNFFGLVGTIAAELTGSFRSDISRGSQTPDAMFAKGAGAIVTAISHASGAGGAGGKETEEALQGDGTKQREGGGGGGGGGSGDEKGGGKEGATGGGEGATGGSVGSSAGGGAPPAG